jgi:hypothetical protein
MKVSSESDNEVEIDLYWSNIKVDKLQNLGNPRVSKVSSIGL